MSDRAVDEDERSAAEARHRAAVRAGPARERCQEVFGDSDLPGTCMAIKMGLSGSSEWPGFPSRLHPDRPDKDWSKDLTTCRDALAMRLDTWVPSTFTWENTFDIAIFALVNATVRLIDRELREHTARQAARSTPETP